MICSWVSDSPGYHSPRTRAWCRKIDRFAASAYQGGIAPVLCLNKADLVDPVDYQPLVGLYSQLGIPCFLTSATTGLGISSFGGNSGQLILTG